MTRSVLSLAILLAALSGSLLQTKAVRSDTGDDPQATESQDNGCCPAMRDPLYEEEYGYYYEGRGCDPPQNTPKCDEPEENVASDQTGVETESTSEVDAEEYANEDVDYWYDSETGEYYDHDFADENTTEEMPIEDTAETVAEQEDPFADPADDEASILIEDASIAATEEELAAQDEMQHAYEEMYDYDDEDAYDYYGYGESSAEEKVEETTESIATEESEEVYDYYCDESYWEEEEDSHFEEESIELVEETPESSTDESVDDFDYGYEYGELYEEEYAKSMEQVAEETADEEVTEESDEFDYGYEYWDEYEYGEDVEQIADDSEQVAEETPVEEVTEESDEFDYGDEYWDEYDYYYEDAVEAEIVENTEDGELGADAELECWIEADLEELTVASQQQEQSDNDREAILSLARTLDRAGTALQALSRHLTELADAEVAELPTSDETIQR